MKQLNESKRGYNAKQPESNLKSGMELIEQLIKVVCCGGNLLLNVGPTANGIITEPGWLTSTFHVMTCFRAQEIERNRQVAVCKWRGDLQD